MPHRTNDVRAEQNLIMVYLMSRSHNNGCGRAKCGMCKSHKRFDKNKGKCRKNFKASVRRKLQDD